ncbi:hypothetical protein KIN20_031119 [Parelaphostrongylus tenuis]|uniref:Uncharacterized protein n=1 Tax=Parelaphostrongylus tenuis TaxID=148309 RepID=A0AAD5R6D9_PARTN|nr:hypothetical protein KIN20_031119 [Parelaphostrongylus tenuis]
MEIQIEFACASRDDFVNLRGGEEWAGVVEKVAISLQVKMFCFHGAAFHGTLLISTHFASDSFPRHPASARVPALLLKGAAAASEFLTSPKMPLNSDRFDSRWYRGMAKHGVSMRLVEVNCSATRTVEISRHCKDERPNRTGIGSA